MLYVQAMLWNQATVLDMSTINVAITECSSAHLANKGFFAGVGSVVVIQVLLSCQLFPTKIADEAWRILGFPSERSINREV